MIKREEAVNPNSCWNKAKQEELVFVFLERDKAAPDTVRFWCAMRIKKQLNDFKDAQIQEALSWATAVDGINVYSDYELINHLSFIS